MPLVAAALGFLRERATGLGEEPSRPVAPAPG